LNTLPGGAYVITCLANPWPAAEHFKLLDNLDSSVKSAISSASTGIRGDYVIGLYPTQLKSGHPKGIDLLLELRPTEGNNPVAEFNRLIKSITGNFSKNDVPIFESFKVDGADHAYRLNKGVASLLRMALRTGMQADSKSFGSLVDNKNLVFANVGHNVLIATSEAVLRKAVGALKFGRSPLAADPKYTELARDGAKPTQFVLAASLTRSASFLMSEFGGAKMGGKPLIPMDGAIGMLKGLLSVWPDPLLLRFSIIQNGLSARIFVPLAFDELGNSLPMMGGG
jgi:hypothetical protein